MLLRDKTALIYGGSGAVGGAVARAFAREGAKVIVAARRREPQEQVVAAIRDAGGYAEATVVDAFDADGVAQHLDGVVARHWPVKLMFNATSWDDTQGTSLTEMPFGKFLAPVQLALTGWFHTGTALARHMGQNGGGVILGVTANAGREPFAGVGGFGVACAAVEHYLRQLAVENGPNKVRVCWVRSPGSPDAPGVREAWELYGQHNGMTLAEVETEFGKDTPLRRVTPLAQVADAAVLLASDLAAGMTATLANATGGAQID